MDQTNTTNNNHSMRDRFPVTFFPDWFAKTLTVKDDLSLDDICQMVLSTTAIQREKLPWLKLAKFGTVATDKGCLRNDDNVLSIDGAEGDYDGEEMTFEKAVELIRNAGVMAVMYTSPSHTSNKPRWRVVAPTSKGLPPSERYKMVARINGILGGVLSIESFTLSQSYYYGSVNRNPDHRAVVIAGDFVDLRDDLDVNARGKPTNGAAPNDDGAAAETADDSADARELPRAIAVLLHVPDAGKAHPHVGYASRSELAIAFITLALHAGVGDQGIVKACCNPKYARCAVYEHCRVQPQGARAYVLRQIAHARGNKPFDDSSLIRNNFQQIKIYNYTALDGTVLYQALLYQHRFVKSEETVVLRHRDRYTNEWVFGPGRVKVPYRWVDLAAKPDADVFVVSDEKAADRLADLGLVATAVPSKKWSETAAEALRDRNVHILEDNDATAREDSEAIAEALRLVAKSIRIVKLSGLQHKDDVTDWLDAGHTKDELLAVCSAAPTWGVFLTMLNVWNLDGVDVPQQEWAVPDRIPAGFPFLFSGEGAAGKSTIQLQLGAAHALGLEWLGVMPQLGPALFIDAEDDEKIIHKRLHDILHYYDRKFIDLKDKLHVASLIDQDAVLGAANRKSGMIEPTQLYSKITEMVGDIKPVMISIASSANVYAGSELDRSQVQQFVALLTKLARFARSGMVLISHPSLSGISTGSGISGSTQWHNAVRARSYIKGVKDEEGEPEGNLRQIEFRKNNYGPISESIVVKYRNGLFLPIANTTVDQETRKQQAEETYLTVLKKLIGQHQELSGTGPKSHNYAPRIIAEHPLSTTFTTQEMEAAQQRLLDANKIHITTVGPPSKLRKYIRLGPDPNPGIEPM